MRCQGYQMDGIELSTDLEAPFQPSPRGSYRETQLFPLWCEKQMPSRGALPRLDPVS